MGIEEGAIVLIRPSGRNTARHRSLGFTLIELMITVTLLAILMMLAAPSMMEWVRNSKVRAVSEALQNGLREAQSESLRRSRQVVFALTDSKPTADSSAFTAKTDGNHWTVRALPSMAGESSAFVSSGILTDVGPGVTITGPAVVCFNSVGRLVPNTTSAFSTLTGGATCSVDAASPPIFDIQLDGADRPLRVLVALGGQVRMCDPKKTMSNAHPDGCPASS
ncbi:type IV fimbrial biogenesis protein FimT [Variovorax boronicumulans]|uniref:prepilin-type N-terminal cleavage/methylation domain-containing protein n=1 Tax=Variovorax boronicumulans TaxID=436515 RepID=UPI0033941F97